MAATFVSRLLSFEQRCLKMQCCEHERPAGLELGRWGPKGYKHMGELLWGSLGAPRDNHCQRNKVRHEKQNTVELDVKKQKENNCKNNCNTG